MTDPSTIQATLLAGEALLASESATILSNYPACLPLPYKTELFKLNVVTWALRKQVDNAIYNGTTEELYTLLAEYLGNYDPTITTVINFTQPNPMQVGDADQTLVATSNSPAVITFQSSDTTIATIVNGNQLHAVAPGSVTITASQVAQAPYSAGSSPKTVTISQLVLATPVITVTNITDTTATINVQAIANATDVAILVTYTGGSANTTINGSGPYSWPVSSLPSNSQISVQATAHNTSGQTIINSQTGTAQFNTMSTVYYGYSDTPNLADAQVPNTKAYDPSSSSLSISWPLSYDQKYLVFKVPASQPLYTTWYNSALNQGQIPDQLYNSPVLSGGYNWYMTRDIASVDPQNPVFTYSA